MPTDTITGQAGRRRELTRGRASFCWFAPYPALLGSSPCRVPAAALGRSITWRNVYLEAGQGTGVYRRPWPVMQDNPGARDSPGARALRQVWNRYATGDPRRNVSSREAWRHLLPLRLPTTLRLDSARWRVRVHPCVYPHGAGCIVDAEFTSPRPTDLDYFCDSALTIRWARRSWTGMPGAARLSLDDVCYLVLREVLRRLSGARRPRIALSRDAPFTVVSVVQGGADAAPVDWALRQRAIALTRWRSGWRGASVEEARDVGLLPIEVQGSRGTMLCAPAGRFLWMPELFQSTLGAPHDLADLHRATTWMSLQVDALGALAEHIVSDDRPELSATLYSLRRSIAGLFGRLQGGAGTVAMASIPRQIADRGYSDAVRLIRDQEQLTPLSRGVD